MQITPYHTAKIQPGDNLLTILDHYLPKLREKEIVAITSKIVSICQGRVVKDNKKVDKEELIKNEADFYIEDKQLWERYHLMLAIKDNFLIPNAGIDESNGHDHFILWPQNIHQTTADIWNFLRKNTALSTSAWLSLIATLNRCAGGLPELAFPGVVLSL